MKKFAVSLLILALLTAPAVAISPDEERTTLPGGFNLTGYVVGALVSNIGLYLNSPVALYFSQGDGTYYDDESINDYTGTLGGLNVLTDTFVKGLGPSLLFNASSDYVSLGDEADFSFISGGVDAAVTIFVLFQVEEGGASDKVIISKWDENLGSEAREWNLTLDQNNKKLKFLVADESADAYCQIITDAALTIGWHTAAVTYDGTGGANCLASGNCVIYVDGESVAATASAPTGTYANMEDLSTTVEIGCAFNTSATRDGFFNSHLGFIIIDDGEMSAADVYTVHLIVENIYDL